MNTSASRLFVVLALMAFLSSCKVLQQANEMKTFAKCEFRLKNIETITLANVDITDVDQFSDLSFSEATNISMIAMKGKLPLYFTRAWVPVAATSPAVVP